MTDQHADLVAIVREQAEDPNLWRRDGGLPEEGGVPVTLFERELQAALERLHQAVLLNEVRLIDGQADA